jgi:hypothetical protein
MLQTILGEKLSELAAEHPVGFALGVVATASAVAVTTYYSCIKPTPKPSDSEHCCCSGKPVCGKPQAPGRR